MSWEIRITSAAKAMLAAVTDRRVRQALLQRIDGLAEEPDKQGKALTGELVGVRSLRAVGQRYRILYQLNNRQVVVVVVALGLRKAGSKQDVYELGRKLLRLRLLEPR